jgi:hypothetical protein
MRLRLFYYWMPVLVDYGPVHPIVSQHLLWWVQLNGTPLNDCESFHIPLFDVPFHALRDGTNNYSLKILKSRPKPLRSGT